MTPSMSSTRRITPVLWSLAQLSLIVVVVPVALARVGGWPLPTTMPSIEGIANGLLNRLEIGPVVKVLALGCWVSWVLVMWAIGAELAAVRTGRPPRHRRGLSPFQHVAMRVVGGLVMTVPGPLLGGVAGATPIQQLPAMPSATSVHFSEVVAPTVEQVPGMKSVVVEPADSLFKLAEDHLGDPLRWREIWELNQGRTMDDGSTFSRPELIRPGWVLVVATEPVPEVQAVASTFAGTAAPEVVAPGTCAVPLAELDSGPGAGPAAPEPVETVVPSTAPRGETSRAEASASAVAPFAGGIMLTSGVLALATARRRRRLRGMRAEHDIGAMSPVVARLERELRHRDRAGSMVRVDYALKAAGIALTRTPVMIDSDDVADVFRPRAARPQLVLVHADSAIEILFDRSLRTDEAPLELFVRGGSADRMVLPAAVTMTELGNAIGESLSPCPTLVHLGQAGDAATTVEVFVDLEALGALALDGSPTDVADIARALVASLAVSPFAEAVDIWTSGLDTPILAGRDRVTTARHDVLLAELDKRSTTIGAICRSTGDTFTARMVQPDEALEAFVAVSFAHDGVDPPVGTGCALITDRASSSGRSLGHEGGVWSLAPIGLELRPVGLTIPAARELSELLDDACSPPVLRPPAQRHEAGGWVEPDWQLMVRLIGPVEVTDRSGTPAEFERSKATELVVWLEQHRDRPLRSMARSSMWASDVRDATFANVVSDARRALARLVEPPAGEEWIGRGGQDRIPLHDGVTSDARLLASRLDAARGLEFPADAVEVLLPGLELIRAMPFSGSDYLWPDGEAIPSALVHLCTSAALLSAEHLLAVGRTDECLSATAVGLKVLQGHEGLVCLRLRAYGAAGNLAAVRAEYAAYERVVMADSWGDGEPAAQVVAERNRLLTAAK